MGGGWLHIIDIFLLPVHATKLHNLSYTPLNLPAATNLGNQSFLFRPSDHTSFLSLPGRISKRP